jgi:hypothetical protein
VYRYARRKSLLLLGLNHRNPHGVWQ